MTAGFDFRELVVKVDTRDAELLSMIEQLTALMDKSSRLIHLAERRYKADDRRYKQLWKEALSTAAE